MNCWHLRLWRKTICLRFTQDEEERVSAAHRSVDGIVKLRIGVPVFSQLLHTLCRTRAQIIEPPEDDRFGGTNLCARRWEPALLAIITESALEGAAGVGQRLRTTIDNAKRTGYDTISAAVANIVLHKHRADFGAHNRAGGTRFQTTGFLAMLANIGKKHPAKRIFSIAAA